MTVDEIIADVRTALGLDPDEILVNVIVLGEFVTLSPDADSPERRRLAFQASEELEPWTSIGMLRFAQMQEHRAIGQMLDED